MIAGAVGVLAGLHHLFSAKDRIKDKVERSSQVRDVSASGTVRTETRRNYFSIRRTKSELGYVYWVLQGYGNFQCFVLYDTWKEAVDEASQRISDYRVRSVAEVGVAVTA